MIRSDYQLKSWPVLGFPGFPLMIPKPLQRPLGDTEYMLEQWGWWRMDGMGIPSYASPKMAIMGGVRTESGTDHDYETVRLQASSNRIPVFIS